MFLPDENKDTLINPVAVFEVLSESTREYDLGLKFTMYSTITSLREYIAVEQDSVLVHHWHKDSGEWIKEEHTAGAMRLLSVGISLNIDDLYLDVSF